MLEMLDVLIGFVLVMLIMSMAVTMLTQLIGSAIFNLRGRALRIGAARLLALLDRGLNPAEALAIANHILRNPLVGEPPVLYRRHSLAGTVHREELVKLILDFAVNGDAERAHDDETVNEEALRDKNLPVARLERHQRPGKNPQRDPQRGAQAGAEQSRDEPQRAAQHRDPALCEQRLPQQAQQLVRPDDRPRRRHLHPRIRIVTALVAVAVALVVHLDAISLINRLSADDALRDQLVAAAVERGSGRRPPNSVTSTPPDAAAMPPATPTPGTAAMVAGAVESAAADEAAANQSTAADEATEASAAERGGDRAGRARSDCRDPRRWRRRARGIRPPRLPPFIRGWKDRWSTDGGPPGWGELFMRLFGILLSAALLSLGAPFWYSTLGSLVKLRSVISRKDDAEREERQTTQAPAAGSPAVSP